MDNDAKWFNELRSGLKEDFELLFGECIDDEGVLRAIVEHLGASDVGAIIEAAIEGMPDGDEGQYPVVHFSFTLAKDIDEEAFAPIINVLNDLNVLIQTAEYPSFGTFGLYKPMKQIFYGYRMPVNTASAEAERENIRYFLATVVTQLDLFIDLIHYVCNGYYSLSLDRFVGYLKLLKDVEDTEERTRFLEEKIKELELEDSQS